MRNAATLPHIVWKASQLLEHGVYVESGKSFDGTFIYCDALKSIHEERVHITVVN